MTGGRKRLNEQFPERLHNLGAWGPYYNTVAIFFVVQAIVIYVLPATLPVTVDNMNYGELGDRSLLIISDCLCDLFRLAVRRDLGVFRAALIPRPRGKSVCLLVLTCRHHSFVTCADEHGMLAGIQDQNRRL